MIYHLCDFKMLCFYLTVSWFGNVYKVMERSHRKVLGRNNYEQKTKSRFQIPSEESNTELKTVMPCNYTAAPLYRGPIGRGNRYNAVVRCRPLLIKKKFRTNN